MKFCHTRLFHAVAGFVLLALAVSASGAELVSAHAGDSSQSGASGEPSISGDGRYVVFSSLAALDAGDTNGISDVYLKDRKTGSLRRLSDQRGGDQPMISANGRYVIYRALEVFPKTQLVDLESSESPRTVSYPFNNNSFRTADSAVISPDGMFVAFPFRPIPGFNNATDPQLCVNTTTEPDHSNATTSITKDFLLNTLGRCAMTRDGNTFFLVTKDGLRPADTNGDRDIYMATRGSNFVIRLSATDAGLPEKGGAFNPVVTADGSSVFFISERRLRQGDADGRNTLYRSKSAENFAIPRPIATSVQPVALSQQATSDGQYLAFLGKSGDGSVQPYLLRVSDGALKSLASSATEAKGLPVISADNGFIAFASDESLDPHDGNQAPDVYLVPNPFGGARSPKPIVSLSGVTDGQITNESTTLALNGTATSSRGMLFTALEVDGNEIARAASGTVQRSLTLSRGFHTIRTVALDVSNVPGHSDSRTITVLPAANSLQITGLRNLQRRIKRGGAIAFSATMRVDNTFAAASGQLQVVLSEVPDAATWENFGQQGNVPAEPERFLELTPLPSVAGGSASTIELKGIVPPPRTLGDGFQGRGATIVARLRELVGANWVDRDELMVFEVRPPLNEDTPGPNGGVPVLNPNIGGTTFNPTILQSLQIQGASQMAEQTSQTYTATAIFNTGSQACRPVWGVEGGGSLVAISALGVLTAGELHSPLSVNVKASFGGKTQTFPVSISPSAPVVTVIAPLPFATEAGVAGMFKILRTPVKSVPLTVTYKVTGSAFPGQDYVALSGTAVIPAGRSGVKLPVTPLNDNFIEGREKVKLTILPSPDYRIGSAQTAVVKIEDDEPGQPDAIIQAEGAAPVGAFQFGFDGSEQRASAHGAKDKPSVFFCRFVNRTTSAQTFKIGGSSDYLGFAVRYFEGAKDVTSDVVAETYIVSSVPAGDHVLLKLRITPSAETPLGGVIRCPVTLTANNHVDAIEASVRRTR